MQTPHTVQMNLAAVAKDQLPTHAVDVNAAALQQHRKQLSVIIEADEDTENAARPAWARSSTGQSGTMLLQALLVDASTTLCAYLYHTSIQARLAAQQQHAMYAIAAICAHLPASADVSAKILCSDQLAHRTTAITAAHTMMPYQWILALTAIKFLMGFLLMTYASHYIRPFDLLVTSGAAHCLALYCLFFMPMAKNLHPISAGVQGPFWLAVLTNFLWLITITSGAVIAFKLVALLVESRKPAIRLADDEEVSSQYSEKVTAASV